MVALTADIIPIERWRSPASEYPRQRHGRARVRTGWYEPAYYACYLQRGYQYFLAERRLYITTLQIDGETWMVDDPPHWWAMEEHARHYHGHVLCAGLGLGLMVHALAAYPAVERITVIERERDVIDLIEPLLPPGKLTVIEGDFHEVMPRDLDPVDGVLYDLFVGNAFRLLGEAMTVMATMLDRWATAPEFPIRIHGFPQRLLLGQDAQ